MADLPSARVARVPEQKAHGFPGLRKQDRLETSPDRMHNATCHNP
jgi:hypothetical protein